MGKGILIVDDAAFMRMIIRDILTKNGYEVVGEAKDGKEAITLNKQLPDANVVMCSALGQQAMVIDSIQAGAKDYIVKPFQADRVIEAVSKIIG